MDEEENSTSTCWDISTNVSAASKIALQLVYGKLDASLITIFMPCILVVGYIGNFAFLIVVFRISWMRTFTNRYLINLAISDLIFLTSSVSYSLWQFYGSNGIYNEVFLGVEGCVTLPALADTAHLASISFITLVAIERYYAVCKPHMHNVSVIRKHCLKLVIASWISALCLALALNIPSRHELPQFCVKWPQSEDIPDMPTVFAYCRPVHNSPTIIRAVNIFQTLPYIVSFIANAFLYTSVIYTLRRKHFTRQLTRGAKTKHKKKRNRITAMLVINGSVFFLCLTPFEFISLYLVISDTDDMIKRRTVRTWVDLCRITVYINSVINPFLYNAINPRYRMAFNEAFGITSKGHPSTSA